MEAILTNTITPYIVAFLAVGGLFAGFLKLVLDMVKALKERIDTLEDEVKVLKEKNNVLMTERQTHKDAAKWLIELIADETRLCRFAITCDKREPPTDLLRMSTDTIPI